MKTIAVMVLALFAIPAFAAHSDLCVINVEPIVKDIAPDTTEDTSDDIIIPVMPNGESAPAPTDKNDDKVPVPATHDTTEDMMLFDDADDDSDIIDDELEYTAPEGSLNNSDSSAIEHNPLQF
ncbi:MAG: hypothetical protein Q8M03_17015 [Legionella sp.]|nr:hypothetical protein [Legionella sp.]